MSAVAGAESRIDQKAWFLRALLVLQSPRPVFAAIRDDSDEVAEARQDAAGAIVWLGGIAGILATTVAGRLLDDVEIDGSLVAVWAFLAGGLYGFGLYYVVGKVLHVSLRRLGGRGSFRRARHLLAFAATPIALALFVYWPIRIAIYGADLFRTGGPDGRGAGAALAWVFYAFVAWALVLLVVGVRTVHGWSWGRSLGGVAIASAIAAGLAVAVSVLYAF
ncbi:MAG TPA: Yip1 family protein [Gaiellaceae bacterium]